MCIQLFFFFSPSTFRGSDSVCFQSLPSLVSLHDSSGADVRRCGHLFVFLQKGFDVDDVSCSVCSADAPSVTHRGRAQIILGGGGERLKGAGCRKRQSK